MGSGCSSAAEPTYVPIEGGCPICDNRPSKDATWAEKFEVTHERLQHLAKLNEKTSFCGTFPGLVDLLTARTTSDVEQFWVLFQWVQREGRRQQPRKSLPGDSPFEFLRAVKDGKRSYADLYQKLCSTADLKCKTVTGLCKSTGNQAGRPSGERGNVTFKSSSWNVVTINGRRALVDCQFELNFDPDRMPPCYFLSLPTHFATTHFPDDRSLQLLQGSVTLAQFRSHDTCLKSSARGKVAAEGSPVRKKAKRDEPKEERKTSEAESREDPDSDPIMTLDELKDDRLKPIPEGYTHHIMISYCHKQRKKVAKIRKHLDKLGYKVWIDEEDMEGTLASSMAKGIINAAIVLTALSDDYVQSDYCKQEAILANKMKRKIVPLKMADYKPDDWVDLLIAGLLYVDFSSTQSFTGQLKKLESEIENRLKEVAAEGPPVEDEANSDETQDERETSGNSSEAESMEYDNNDPMMTLREPKGIRIKAPPDGCSHHIMISYCYKQQKKVAKIRAHLNKVGYKVWSDENMEGTLLSTKARGIKNAAIVLIALSDDYVQNYDCKKEAILAKEEKRKIIPMKMADYKPGLWLALLIAGLSSVDFSSTRSFTGQLKKLKSKIEKGLEKLREVEKKESM